MAGPQAGEVVTPGRQLPDQIGERLVVGRPARLGTQEGDRVIGAPLPVGPEFLAGRVEEHEARVVGRAVPCEQRRVEDGCVQRASQRVGGQDVEARVAYVGRHVGHRVQQPQDRGPYACRGHRGPSARRCRRAGEVVEVGAFGLVQLECAREGVEHGVRSAGEVPAFEPDVVVHAHAREQGDLLAAEAGDTTVSAVDRQPGLLRGDPCPPCAQELADLGRRGPPAGVSHARVPVLLRWRRGRTRGVSFWSS